MAFYFHSLQTEYENFEKLGQMVILRDLNAVTGTLPDYIVDNDVNNFLPLDADYTPDTCMAPRSSQDS